MTSSSRARQRGFTYLGALILVAVVGLGLAATGETWSRARQREKEADLIWIGNQFKQAIGLYYQRSPGAVKRYPETLAELLEDKRFLSTQRYLRNIYADPLTGKPQWGLVRAPGGGVMGIYSLAEGRPVNSAAFPKATSYREWRFSYEPPASFR
jgi:type II secretory pathway pseudopilin PulG